MVTKITDVDTTFQQPSELHGKVLQVGKNKFVRLVDLLLIYGY